MDPTRMSDNKILTAQILKQVDQLVKSNNLERALCEVKKVRDIDPQNVYAFAYEEHIQELYAKRQVQQVIHPGHISVSPIREEIQSYPASMPASPPPKTDFYGMKVPSLYEEFKKVALLGSSQAGKTAQLPPKAAKEALDTYKQALLLIWSDGEKTHEEEQELFDLRTSLFISEEEHAMLERQAKLECYIIFLKHVYQSSASKAEVDTSLAEFRRHLNVSTSDHLHIETNLAALKAKERQITIVVIDDDKRILAMVSEILTLAHYAVQSFITSDLAFEYVTKKTTDLILCDINLETSTMNGFMFYEKIHEFPQLRQLPFIFISGLNDALLILAAKEMGIDDFLIKPIRRENLLATLYGRLKRFEEMKILSELK